MVQVKGELDAEGATAFYACFKHLASKSDNELRRACCSQVSLFLRAALGYGPHIYATHFHDLLVNLAGRGGGGQVRWCIRL